MDIRGEETYNHVIEFPFGAAVVFAGFQDNWLVLFGARASATDSADDGEEVLASAHGGNEKDADFGHLVKVGVEMCIMMVAILTVFVTEGTSVAWEFHFCEGG